MHTQSLNAVFHSKFRTDIVLCLVNCKLVRSEKRSVFVSISCWVFLEMGAVSGSCKQPLIAVSSSCSFLLCKVDQYTVCVYSKKRSVVLVFPAGRVLACFGSTSIEDALGKSGSSSKKCCASLSKCSETKESASLSMLSKRRNLVPLHLSD